MERTQTKARMTTERHWERFDESDHGNAQQMFSVAEDAIEEISQWDKEKPRIAPHLFNQLIIDVAAAVRTYGATQQLRTHLVKTVSKYVEPDHPHTRDKR